MYVCTYVCLQILKQRDREHENRVETLSSANLSQESKCQRLEREVARAQTTIGRLRQELAERVSESEELGRAQKEKVWQFEGDMKAMEEKVEELEGEKVNCHAELQRLRDNFQRKYVSVYVSYQGVCTCNDPLPHALGTGHGPVADLLVVW